MENSYQSTPSYKNDGDDDFEVIPTNPFDESPDETLVSLGCLF